MLGVGDGLVADFAAGHALGPEVVETEAELGDGEAVEALQVVEPDSVLLEEEDFLVECVGVGGGGRCRV
mgnify:FL=1